MDRLRRLLQIPSPDETVKHWHVSAPVDLMAYAFSWVWVLIPMAFLGDAKMEYIGWYLLILAVTDMHRHISFPYVYMDKQVSSQYPLRFFMFPALLLVLWMASPWLARQPIYWSVPQILGALGVLVVVIQVLRRDGSSNQVGGRQISVFAAPSFAIAAVLSKSGIAENYGFDSGWWWLFASLVVSSRWDLALRSKTENNSGDATGERPMTFVYSGVILVLMLLALGSSFVDPKTLGLSAKGVKLKLVINSVAVFAGLWNFWHVYMQKFGIMRLYNAKARAAAESPKQASEAEVPAWIDRLFIFAWLPLYFAWLGPLYREVALKNFSHAKHVLPGFISWLESVQPITLPLAGAFLLTAIALFVRAEWKASRFRNKPRLYMALGMLGLSAAFLWADPVKAYLSFSFSHAVEYAVFVWAFQRKRYQHPLPHKPLLGRIIRHRAFLFYLIGIVGVGCLFLYLKYWGKYIFPEFDRPKAFGFTTAHWIFYWGIYQSMVHFYFDGFLWKMRLKQVRANI